MVKCSFFQKEIEIKALNFWRYFVVSTRPVTNYADTRITNFLLCLQQKPFFSYNANKESVGYFVDLMKELSSLLNWQVTWVVTDHLGKKDNGAWTGLFSLIQNEVGFGINADKFREDQVDNDLLFRFRSRTLVYACIRWSESAQAVNLLLTILSFPCSQDFALKSLQHSIDW